MAPGFCWAFFILHRQVTDYYPAARESNLRQHLTP